MKSGVTTYATSYTPVAAELDPTKGPFHWFLTAYDAHRQPVSLTYEHTFNLAGAFPTTAAAALTPLSGRSGRPGHQPAAVTVLGTDAGC